MKIKYFFLFLTALFLTACADEPSNNSTSEEKNQVSRSVDDIKVPEKKENPVNYWDMKSIKIQNGKEGYLRSTHKIDPGPDKIDPNPVNVVRKDDKILKIASGDYDEDGEITGRTDFYFEQERLSYVKGMDYKIYIQNDSIYKWIDKNDQEVKKDSKIKKMWVDSLNERVSEIMNHVGLKFNREKQ